MRIFLRLFLACGVFGFCFNSLRAAPVATNQPAGFCLIIELQDGSKIIGKNGDDNLQFRSDVLGEMKLPLERIRSIACQSKTNSVQLTTTNGDILTAQFVSKAVRVDAAFGSFKLPVNLIKHVQISVMGKLVPTQPGMVALWSGEGDGNDPVGGHNGVLEGGIDFAPGKVGDAFLFNNENADVKIPSSPALDVGSGNGFTLAAWINPADVSQRHPLFEWNVGDGATYWGIHFHIDPISFHAGPGALYANIVDNDGRWHQIHSAGGTVLPNVFQRVALTYDKTSGMAKIYCNGVVVAQQNLGRFTPQTTYDLYLGKRPLTQGETYTFAGLLDEAAIYNRVLSTSEIQADYAAGGGN